MTSRLYDLTHVGMMALAVAAGKYAYHYSSGVALVVAVYSALTYAVMIPLRSRKRQPSPNVVAFLTREQWETQRVLEAQRRILEPTPPGVLPPPRPTRD